jgi:hypothetical protein
VQHGKHDRAGERDVHVADLGDDQRLALLHLAEQPADGQQHEQQHDDHHAACDENGLHVCSLFQAGATQKNSPSMS